MNPKLGRKRQARYELLRAHAFTRRESRELSVLPKSNPALRLLIVERDARRSRFEKIAAYKIHTGAWKRQDIVEKWTNNLLRMYTKRGWRVKHGAVGAQPAMPKGTPNPWAMYRAAEQRTGGPKGKPYVSPWQLRAIRKGKTALQKGLVFIQKQEKKAGGTSKQMLRNWIADKDEAIGRASGKRRQQLIIERNRLERLLANG